MTVLLLSFLSSHVALFAIVNFEAKEGSMFLSGFDITAGAARTLFRHNKQAAKIWPRLWSFLSMHQRITRTRHPICQMVKKNRRAPPEGHLPFSSDVLGESALQKASCPASDGTMLLW